MIELLFIGYILSCLASLYFYFYRRKLSKRIAENYMNKNINKLIIEAQLNYSASDNIVLISKWVKLISVDDMSPIEVEMFNEMLNNSKL